VRFVAANLHPDHDRITVFRRCNKAAFEAALKAKGALTYAAGSRAIRSHFSPSRTVAMSTSRSSGFKNIGPIFASMKAESSGCPVTKMMGRAGR
jgi:hypothetical protein